MNCASFAAVLGRWQPGPQPNRPAAVRIKGAAFFCFSFDPWLNREIFGADYEWAEIL